MRHGRGRGREVGGYISDLEQPGMHGRWECMARGGAWRLQGGAGTLYRDDSASNSGGGGGKFRHPWESPSSNICAALPTPTEFARGKFSCLSATLNSLQTAISGVSGGAWPWLHEPSSHCVGPHGWYPYCPQMITQTHSRGYRRVSEKVE